MLWTLWLYTEISDLSLLILEVFVSLEVWFNQNSGPVALQLKEQRVAEGLAIVGATLDEEAVRLVAQKLVDDRGLLELAFEVRLIVGEEVG